MRGLAQGRIRQVLKSLLPAAVIGLGLGATTLAHPAAAQFFGEWGGEWGGGWGGGNWGGLRPGEINREIAEQGFRAIAPLRRKGAVFIADVVDRRGRRERLIIAAADAQILQRYYLDDPRLPGFVPRNALAGQTPESPMDRADRGDGIVPPANIPGAVRPGRGQAYGTQGDGNDQAYGNDNGQDDGVEPMRPRALPPKPLKPKPRIVDRTPDAAVPQGDGMAAQPPKGRQGPGGPVTLPAGTPDQANDRPAAPPARVANRPPEPAKASVGPPSGPAATAAPAPAAPSSTTTRLRDPLALPGGEPKSAGRPLEQPRASAATNNPPRVVPGSVSGAPSAAPTKPAPTAAKGGDVPVAPLD